MTDRYAVIGNPVAHSRSPAIHAEFARQAGHDLSYGTLLAELDAFEQTVQRFRTGGGRGLNVTVPFKQRAYSLADCRTARAERARAVNTLTFGDGAIAGDNTDGVGLIRDLTVNLGCALEGRRVLLLGAGGAAYGVCAPLLQAGPDALVVANRTLAKAVELCNSCRDIDTRGALSASGYAELAGGTFDLVVNATSAGLADAMPPLPAGVYAPGALAYEMVYGRVTRFMAQAAGEGVRTADGLGMLVEQAAESFYIWRGVRPDTAPVIAQLRTTR
jgi:shikimate dehydrogenase